MLYNASESPRSKVREIRPGEIKKHLGNKQLFKNGLRLFVISLIPLLPLHAKSHTALTRISHEHSSKVMQTVAPDIREDGVGKVCKSCQDSLLKPEAQIYPVLCEKNGITVIKCSSKEAVGEICAREIADLIHTNQQKEKKTVLGLATGSTPLPVYEAFIRIAQEEELDLSQVITFNLDEYVGLPPKHPQSYNTYMEDHLFFAMRQSEENPKGLRPENIHLLNGYAKTIMDLSSEEFVALKKMFPNRSHEELLSSEEELSVLRLRTEKYEQLIQRFGPIDLQILGIGTNGHIGFAEPGSSFEGRTSIIQLAKSTRQDNQRFFIDDEVEVPSHAITMGIGTILQAKKILLLAMGEQKRAIVSRTLTAPISSSLPATALREHPQVFFILDPVAAGNLR